MRQPRLRLAWLIAFGRSCYWSTFFIYGALLMIEGGLGKTASGILISASQIVLCTAYLFGKISERTGVRMVISLSFAVAVMAGSEPADGADLFPRFLDAIDPA